MAYVTKEDALWWQRGEERDLDGRGSLRIQNKGDTSTCVMGLHSALPSWQGFLSSSVHTYAAP